MVVGLRVLSPRSPLNPRPPVFEASRRKGPVSLNADRRKQELQVYRASELFGFKGLGFKGFGFSV